LYKLKFALYQKAFIHCKYELFWRGGSWGKFFSMTTIFYFCDYFPFEEDLTLYLNNFEFPLPKDDLHQV
jgi:hypothetical protein